MSPNWYLSFITGYTRNIYFLNDNRFFFFLPTSPYTYRNGSKFGDDRLYKTNYSQLIVDYCEIQRINRSLIELKPIARKLYYV